MPPLVRLAAVLAALAAFIALLPQEKSAPGPTVRPSTQPVTPPTAGALCPPGTLPDDGVCIPVPSSEPALRPGRSRPELSLPLRPDRSADYSKYKLPALVDLASGQSEERPWGAGTLRTQVVSAPAGSEVKVVALDGQIGQARLLGVRAGVDAGTLNDEGDAVVTLHRVKETTARQYLCLVSGLRARADLGSPGAELPADTPLGVLTSAHRLGFSVRRLRETVTDKDLSYNNLTELFTPAMSVDVDPRNVLVLR